MKLIAPIVALFEASPRDLALPPFNLLYSLSDVVDD